LLPFAIVRLLWLFMVARPTVIVGWLYYGALAASIGRLIGRPVLWSLHAADFDPKVSFKSATRWSIRLCRLFSEHVPTFIQYCSDASRAQHERLGFAVKKSVVINNGVDVDQLATSAAQETPSELAAVMPLWPEFDAKVIGCIARFDPQKDHRTLFEAIVRLKASGKQISLILAGQGCSRYNPTLRALLAELGIEKEVIPLGVISEVGRVLRHCDAIVLSSSEGEALPMVLLEALSVGKPVVATDVGSASVVVGDFGLIVPPRNPAALSQAIEQVVWADPVYSRAAADKAPSYIRSNYSLDETVERWKNLVSRTVGLTGHLPAGR